MKYEMFATKYNVSMCKESRNESLQNLNTFSADEIWNKLAFFMNSINTYMNKQLLFCLINERSAGDFSKLKKEMKIKMLIYQKPELNLSSTIKTILLVCNGMTSNASSIIRKT